MSFARNLHDPLSINLRRQTNVLLSSIPRTSEQYDFLSNASCACQMLEALSNALANAAFTAIVAKLFRPLLMDLCARWIDDTDKSEDYLVALSYLIEVHEELFPVLNQLLLTRFEGGPLTFLIQTTSWQTIDSDRLHRLLLSYYRIQQANRELPRHLLWPLAPLSKVIWEQQLDNGVRLLAIRCYSLQSGMGEAERLKIERTIFGEPCGVDCQLKYGLNLDGTVRELDGWIMPVIEVNRVREEREEIASNKLNFYSHEEMDGSLQIQNSDLSPWIANVHGVLLLRPSTSPTPSSSLIPTPSSTGALQQLALHLSLRLPTLLTSAPSAGKALILNHLAKLVYPERQNQIVSINLSDTSLDARSLLGSYVPSTVHPGTFEWKEGVLVRSMRDGKWVVLEDADRGSPEVLGVIKPLVESLGLEKWIGGRGKLNIPSHGMVVAHDEFRLFATRSLPSREGKFHPPTFFGSHKFSEVVIPSPSSEELSSIIDSKFPRLSGSPAQAIIRMWESIRQLGSQPSGKDVGLRELQKICDRINSLLSTNEMTDISMDHGRLLNLADIFPNPSIREDIYLEARDVFFGIGTPTPTALAHSVSIAEVVGDQLVLDRERQQWVLQGKLAQFNVDRDSNGLTVAVRVGRTCIPARSDKPIIQTNPFRPFAMHKPAISLMSRIVTAISHSEPILLTGETGTGKTSIITHLASLLRQPLISLNLSHQTESSDLIGGLKPVDARIPASALQERFIDLFGATFSRRKNEKFETEISKAVNHSNWKRAVGLWKECTRLAMERIQAKQVKDTPTAIPDDNTPRKRRKTEVVSKPSITLWADFLREVEGFEVQHVHGMGKLAFDFVEGPLVKALKSGDWVLLDEINLASPDTLECISSLLQDPFASITLTEHGSIEPVPRHPNFRLLACMNPATDVGKKDLPPTIRSRFTEIDVPSPDSDKDTLLSIISQYIGQVSVSDKMIIMDVAEFYIAVKQVAEGRQIADGANHRPHFSMRTLARALTFASITAAAFSLRRSVWEGCLMAFTMTLDSESTEVVMHLARKHLLSNVRNPNSMLSREPSAPSQGSFVKFGPFYLEQGPIELDPAVNYIVTPSVARKLTDLSRIILTRRFPVLIEGPTSSGKTSSIEYLAKRTGHRFIRINNHEHTDIQEYLGSYVSDANTGRLVFRDGLLVQALRSGHWIVLDELNLAPTDVLEALNRLLDDNRELVIPETQEVVRPHPHFMLFATQNPSGLYAGRKVLSRAFRNRFLEVHFEDVPQAELEIILCQRCQIAPSYAKRIVSVFQELQQRRQMGRVFESKHGFVTLRDLFRWAGRDAVGYQELADNGYMLLAERARRPEDKTVVREVIESVMGVRIYEDVMYDLQRTSIDIGTFLGNSVPTSSNIVWTKAMQRLYTLVCRALKFREPVLLVGETGTGKTSVCQIFAEASSQRLLSLNCHQNTETADIIGGLRPVRNRNTLQADAMRNATSVLKDAGIEISTSNMEGLIAALSFGLKTDGCDAHTRLQLEAARGQLVRLNAIFEWHDGPLVEAMRNEDIFLMDEISLADDSVLERLNSVLEHDRFIVLAERGGADSENTSIIAAADFKFVATMNPGGDYGKKELSPALRNRFTEIWVPAIEDRRDLELIVNRSWSHPKLQSYTLPLLDFVYYSCAHLGDQLLLSLRDILAWVGFVNSVYNQAAIEKVDRFHSDDLFHHGARMTYLDGLSSLPQLSGYSKEALRELELDASRKLQDLVPLTQPLGTTPPAYDSMSFAQLGSFAIPRGNLQSSPLPFNFDAPTAKRNAIRVLRACQVTKPILMEGSPGVGKTSLITALANLSGHKLCRINLSDQTDLVDLFGSDLPVEGGEAGEFAWKDAEFLKALQEGYWVLLDEMNLAPQAVLEGLNAVLDHRGTVYIPELNKSFEKHDSFRVFAAQNPIHQGGGRKGLPKSFLNRFTKVYMEELTPDDLYIICSRLFPEMDENTLRAMISFNIDLNEKVTARTGFAQEGSPWEFNLRDIVRWATLSSELNSSRQPGRFLRTIYLDRFRSHQDREFARALFDERCSTFSPHISSDCRPWSISPENVQFGCFSMERQNLAPLSRPKRFLRMQLDALESLGICVSHSWLAIITGPRNSGKSSIVRAVADFTGNMLQEVTIGPGTDAMDILGSFEQVDSRRTLANLLDEIIYTLELDIRITSGTGQVSIHKDLVYLFRQSRDLIPSLRISTLIQSTLDLVSGLTSSLSSSRETFQAIQSALQRLLNSSSGTGRFEWVDGPLIKAMKGGQWILLDGANLCNPSVLDRLNSLCESNGFLTLIERGFVNGKVQVIEPNPHFRLFMTVDPQYGELSRAMRNRGVEIFLRENPIGEDSSTLNQYKRLPSSYPRHATQSSTFEAIRRGVQLQEMSTSSVAPTGRSLDQDSALAYLVDASPTLLFPPHIESLNSWVCFLSRTLVPGYMSYVVRYLNNLPGGCSIHPILRKFLINFPNEELNETLKAYRQNYSLSNNAPFSSIFYLPMNFHLNEVLMGGNNTIHKPDSPPSRRVVFDILNLSSALFLHEDIRVSAVDEKHLEGKARLVYQTVSKILEEVAAAGHQILMKLRTPAPTPGLTSASLASLLLSFNPYLWKALNSTSYDFSSLYAVSKWFRQFLQDSDSSFTNIVEHARVLHAAVSPSRGLGLFKLWSCLFLEETPPSTLKTVVWTDQMASSLDSFCDIKTLRSQSFRVTSLETLPSSLIPQEEGLTELRTTLNKHLEASVKAVSTVNFDVVDPQSAILELELLSQSTLPCDVGTLSEIMEEIVGLASKDKRASLLRLSPLQHLLWVFDPSITIDPRFFARAQICWMSGLWNAKIDDSFDNQTSSASQISGPVTLFLPVLLRNAMVTCDMAHIRLSGLLDHDDLIRQQAQTSLLIARESADRFTQLARILLRTFSVVLLPYSKSYESKTLEAIQRFSFENDENFPASFHHALTLMKQTKDETLANILDCELTQFTDSVSSGTPMQVLAYAWISLGRLVFSLTIPDIPVDPAVVQDATYQRLRHEETDLTAQINLHEQLECLLTGSVKNVVTERLRSQLSQIQCQLTKSFNLPQRHDVSRLHVFWSEVIQFQNAVFPEAKLQTLLDALLLGHTDSIQRAQVFQGSLAGFYQRLDTIYPDFSDITVALKLAISYVRLGVNLLSSSGTMNIASPISKTATSLVAFPSLRSAFETILNFNNVDPSSTGIFVPILLGLAASSAEMSLGIRSGQTLSLVEMIYEQAVGIWLIDRARETDRRKDLNSLYRSSTSIYHAVSDAQLEEDEFLAMFPTFEDAFETAAPLSKPDNEKIRLMSRIQVSDAISLLHFHLALTDSQGISVCKEDPADVFRKLRITTIRNLLHRSLKLLPGTLDHEGIHLQLNLLHDNLKHLTAESNANTYNFYFDENYQELRKAASVIRALLQRLKTISDEWPDQMVLKHLIERCDCILNLPATSPVAKVLSMIEQLLTQTDDWEIYAYRETSLKLHRDALVRVIVDWRRLELSCWRTLLDSQTTLFIDELSDWWFHLYDALLRGPLFASNETNMGDGEPLKAYLDSLIPLLDDFMMRSPLGQFHARLRLVQSFQQYTTMVIPRKTSTDKSTLRRINQILHSTCSYYGLFSDRLRKFLEEQKSILEDEVKGFIKLASWKDVNVQALKQSAKKTHHQLYKIVKKFREILRQNIRDKLLHYTSGDEECCELSIGPPPESKQVGIIQFDSQAKASFSHGRLVDIQRTSDKFYALINSRLKPLIWRSSAQCVDELAIEIITTSKDLAGLTVPSKLLGERRERYVKALQVRKRKAWSDLLKEFKHAGLPSNVKPDTLHQNASQTWLRDQPIMPKTSGFDKGEIYFTKLCGSLPALRAAFPTHHSDVSARELQKGMAFLESGFSMAVNMRSWLAVSVDAANQLQRALLRMKTLCYGDNVTVVDPKSHVASVAGLLCKIENSFLELHSHAVIANELGLKPPAPDRFLDEVYSIANSARGMQERLNQLLEDLNAVDLPCITANEQGLVFKAGAFLSHVSGSITTWQKGQPALHFLLSPLHQWLRDQPVAPLQLRTSVSGSNASTSEQLINSLLVCTQTLASRCPNDKGEDTDKYILNGYIHNRDLTRLLHLGEIKDKLADVTTDISYWGDVGNSLFIITPFLDVYLSLAREQLLSLSNWTTALFKLNFVLCSLLLSLCQQGFCKPRDLGDGGDANGEMADETGGLGIGDGLGTDNVSREIEDESQIEGLRGESESKEEQSGRDEGDAIEVNDDFGGELEDIPEADIEEDDDKSVEGEEEEFDETLGNLDPLDPSAVDEKMWGDSKSIEGSDDREGDAGMDHSKERKGPSELVAKEGKEKNELNESSEERTESAEMTDQDEQEVEAEDDSKSDPNVNGAPLERLPDANTLDLPDNIDLGGDDRAKQQEIEDELEDEESVTEEQRVDEQSAMNESTNEPPSPKPDTQELQDLKGKNAQEQANEEDGSGDDRNDAQDDLVGRPDFSMGTGSPDPQNIVDQDRGMPESNGSGVLQTGSDQSPDVQEGSQDNKEPVVVTQPPEAAFSKSAHSGAGSSGVQQGQVPSPGDAQPMANPLRSLGDVLKEIHQRFDKMLEANAETIRQQIGESSRASQLEYLRPDDTDHEMQALGPAGEEQVAHLEQLNIVDDAMMVEDTQMAMDIDKPTAQQQHETISRQKREEDFTAVERRENAEIVLRSFPEGNQEPSSEPGIQGKAKQEEAIDGANKIAELGLQVWRSMDYPEADAGRIWRLYETLTHDLAYALCEQLRLILEPTLATRLKGHYRTGKRLNMKKVIAYIASDFTKDKIWLRRTKPSQREYQVLISLDDSRSMAESHCIHLAYQTLALISKALSRLESGDMALAKFGETVEIIHGLDEGPFTEQAGTKVINAFRFAQKATDVFSLMETSLKFLENARERKAMTSSSAADLWQLQIIISDGMCQDHERLRVTLRKAEEQRVMVVFIILDSLKSGSTDPGLSSAANDRHSILEMKKVDFKMVDGKMELQQKKYLESFPFEYYVVLRNVETLPDVLVGTLKQFLERISEQ